MKRPSVRRIAISAVALATVLAGARPVAGAVIPVTTVKQKISSTVVSLQEAIYSANYDASVAVKFSGTNPVFIPTQQCVAGSGDDSIVLPEGAVFQLSSIIDDGDNPTGPTATPIIFSTITMFAYGATLRADRHQELRLFAVHPMGHLTIRKAISEVFARRVATAAKAVAAAWEPESAIYVMSGGLVVEASTFRSNIARGGTGGSGHSGGGGGIGGTAAGPVITRR